MFTHYAIGVFFSIFSEKQKNNSRVKRLCKNKLIFIELRASKTLRSLKNCSTVMTTQTSLDENDSQHKIYTNDPIAFKNYVNKKVIVTTRDSNVFTGIVYTVDPVSESFILLQPAEKEKKMHMKIIMGSSIENVECSSDSGAVMPEMFVAPLIYCTQEEIAERKELVTKLLSENRFPVTDENNVLCIEDTVKIEPPYRPENCLCLNSVILDRIQTLLSRIPM